MARHRYGHETKKSAVKLITRAQWDEMRAEQMLKTAAPLVPRQSLVWYACQVAKTVLDKVPDGEDRPRIAIETLRSTRALVDYLETLPA